jgi:hypothetical protein
MTGVREPGVALLAGSTFSGGTDGDKSAVCGEASEFMPKNYSGKTGRNEV